MKKSRLKQHILSKCRNPVIKKNQKTLACSFSKSIMLYHNTHWRKKLEKEMKPDIHPDNYRTVLFYDSGADQGWLIRSCANTHGKTMVWKDGVEYPLFSLDTSSASHPVYTGKQRNVNIEGRASKFNQRYQSMMSSFRKDK